MAFPSERTAIVTGAGSERGIGRACVRRLATEGWAVAAIDVDADGVTALAHELHETAAARVLGFELDVADPEAIEKVVRNIESSMPPVVALANIAGVSSAIDALDVTVAEWDRVIDINLRGPFFLCQAVLPGMIERKVGRILNTSSVSAQRGAGSYSKTPYSAAKAGIIGMTRALAREIGEHGITVNAISPGTIDTDIMGGRLTEERKRGMIDALMLNRIGTVEDIAALVSFLLGPEAGFITGATYDINGGLHTS